MGIGMIALVGLFVIAAAGGAGWWRQKQAINKEQKREDAAAAADADIPETDDELRAALRKTRKKKSDSRRLNYRYAQDDPFFFISDNEVWTAVIPESSQDEFKTLTEQRARLEMLTEVSRRTLAFFEQRAERKGFDGVDCHEVLRYQSSNTERWISEYTPSVWNPTQLFNDLLYEKVAPFMADTTPERKRFILVKLGEVKKPTQLSAMQTIIEGVDGVTNERFNPGELEYFTGLAHAFHVSMNAIGAVPAERSDLSWLVRKTFSGPFQPDPEIGYSSTLPWRATHFDRWGTLTGNPLPDMVEIYEPDPKGGLPRRAYVSTLVIEDADPDQNYRGQAAWAKVLARMNYQTEISWRYKLYTAKAWKNRAQKMIKTINEEQDERGKVGLPDDPQLLQKVGLAADLTEDLALEPEPVMQGHLRITVSASTPEEIADAVSQIRSACENDFKLKQERGLQYALLLEQLPGKPNLGPIKSRLPGSIGISRDLNDLDVGERWTDLEALALARLDASPTVGDAVEFDHRGKRQGWRGMLIGWAADNGAPIHFDPHVQTDRGHGGGIAIVGASGSGKSSLGLNLFFWLSESGAQTVVADPKNDFEAFVHYIAFGDQTMDPEFQAAVGGEGNGLEPLIASGRFTPINQQFWDDTEIVDLLRGEPGSSDPFRLYSSTAQARALSREIFSIYLPKESERELAERALDQMIEEHESSIKEGGEPTPLGLGRVAGYLHEEIENYNKLSQKFKNVNLGETVDLEDRKSRIGTLVRKLESARSEDYVRVLFGMGTETGKTLDKLRKRRTVLTLHGVSTPDEDKAIADWSPIERASAATLFAVLYRIYDFLRDSTLVTQPGAPEGTPPRRRPRALIVDEGYIVSRIPQGRRMIDEAMRKGRSWNLVTIFISQQASDLAVLQEKSEGDDAETNQLATVFAFWQSGESESLAALRLLRSGTVDDDPEDARMLSRRLRKDGGDLGVGYCVMRDVDGRVGTIRTDVIFRELWAATQTNANARSADQAEALSPHGADWESNTGIRNEMRKNVIGTTVQQIRRASRIAYEEDDYVA